MAGGKRLVGGAIPGCGLFVHESKSNNRGPPPAVSNGNKPLPMVEQEEKKVNGQIVEILERKCAKQRRIADEEVQKRTAAEAKLEALSQEFADTEQRNAELERQVADLCAAQRDLAHGQKAAARNESALAEVQAERDEFALALKKSQAEVKKLRECSGRTETEWKDQILRLVAEGQSSQRRADEMTQQLEAAQNEHAELTRNAQEVVLRYEEESALRLELESKCLAMEEKLRAKEQSRRSDVDQAHGKAKQSVQARERTEELMKHREEKCQRAEQRAEAAEAKCQALEGELQRLKSLCSRLRSEEAEQHPVTVGRERPLPQGAEPARIVAGAQRTVVQPPGHGPILPQTSAPCEPGVQRVLVPPPGQQRPPPRICAPGVQRAIVPPSRIPPPAPRGHSSGSRPGTATSAISAPSPVHGATAVNPDSCNPASARTAGATNSSVQIANSASSSGTGRQPPGAGRRSGSVPHTGTGEDPSGSGRMPPGAIRRAGSVPTKRGAGRSPDPPPARYASRPPAGGPGGPAPSATHPAAPSVAMSPACGSRPCSSRGSDADCGDRHIEADIPSEPDSSDEEEVLTAM